MKKIFLFFIVLFLGFSFSAIGEFTVPADNEVMETWNETLSRTINPTEFNLLVWNIKKLDKKGAKEDLLKFSKTYDLMLIQEFSSNDILKSYWDTYKNHRIDFAISFSKDDEYKAGVANISNLKMDDLFWVRTVGVEPIIFTPKVVTIATYGFVNKKLMVVNIHSVNFVSDVVYISELKRIEKILSTHQGPLIFAGDFNCWKKVRKQALDAVAKNLNLKFTNFPERDKMVVGTLDHVLYRGVKIVNPHILENIDSSDHKPLSIRIRVE